MDTKYKVGGYGSVVDAIYTEPMSVEDNDNVFITALQSPLSDTSSLVENYTKKIQERDLINLKNLSDFEKRERLSLIYRLRFYLPFEKDLEFEFYNALLISYRSRRLQMGLYSLDQRSRLIGNPGDSTNSGFTLIGYSGCGKSSAIKMLTDHYPQVIKHDLDEIKLIQIVYLTVSCAANSNFKALYANIGRAIDQALNVNVYESMITRLNGLARKQAKVEELIEKFNVGIIIFDEIQLLDFNSTKENSFEALMLIANNTKVAMAVAGTEDSYNKMFSKQRTARRLGRQINASFYCENSKYYSVLLRQLWKYQFFDNYIELTNDIAEKFYSLTKGVMAHTINLFISIQNEYLLSEVRPNINSDYIEKVFAKYYPRLKVLLEDLNSIENRIEIDNLLKEAKALFDIELSNTRQQKEMDESTEVIKAIERNEIINKAIETISYLPDNYPDDLIAKTVKLISDSNDDLDVKSLTKKSLAELKKSKPKKQKPMLSQSDMFNELMAK